jgi:sugar phosphate isomerase/epimerase
MAISPIQVFYDNPRESTSGPLVHFWEKPTGLLAIVSRYNPGMTKTTRRQLLRLASFAAVARGVPAAALSEFKLGVTTDEISDDLIEAARFLGRFGLKYAEIRNLGGKYNTSQPVETIHDAKKLLDEHRIETCILDTGFFKVPLPADNAEGQKALDEQWALLDGAIERAKILGTDKIRTFAFTYPRGGAADKKHYPRIVELVEESARRAKKAGMRLALENVGGSYVATASQAAHMLKKIQDPAFGLTWDPNNSAQEGGESYPEGYEMLDVARIYHVHLRDYRRNAAGKVEWCGVGQGEFDHVGQLRALLKAGYKETLSLETHFRIDGSKFKASEFSIKGLLKAIESV